MELHISIIPETIAHIRGIPVTNTLITSVVVSLGLMLGGWIIGSRAKFIPGKIQNAIEALFEGLLAFMEDTLGDRSVARSIFPVLATIFIFILTAKTLTRFQIVVLLMHRVWI